jgi:alpha-N-arabinofuranosidase
MKIFQIITLFVLFLTTNVQAKTFTNPIIPGSFPDPSICRVGDDYYISNSSFEYFPGVPIWHSKDLVNWQQIGFGIHRPEQFNFDGIASSAGAWASSIFHHKGLFYISFTWVDWRMKVGFKNVILTAQDPSDPWSDPHVITDTIWGIDPALFFDDNGKAYWLMNHPSVGSKHEGASSIMIQEIDLDNMKLIGEPSFIGDGAMIDSKHPEGPKMYKKDGYYYLMVAEGGTGVYHATTISRSKSITGPYENYQGNPILTHRHLQYTTPFINIGHADMVQTQNGEWWMVCLGSRILNSQYNLFGRETFLVPVQWDENQWPVVNPGYGIVRTVERTPKLPLYTLPQNPDIENFDSSALSMSWSFIRTPDDFFTLLPEKGQIELKTLPKLTNTPIAPSFIGKRMSYADAEISTSFSFNPKHDTEEAGLLVYKSELAYMKFVLSGKMQLLKIIIHDTQGEKVLFSIKIKSNNNIQLKIIQNKEKFSCYYLDDTNARQTAIENFDGSIFSVEKAGGFMGTFIGLYAGGIGKHQNKAVFNFFNYQPIDNIN